MHRLFASIFFLILFATGSMLSGAWYWPFGRKKIGPSKPPEVPHTGKYIPTNGDKSNKLYPKIKPDEGVSVKKVEELAEAGNANAQLTLGRIYFEGLVGVKQSYRKALKYFRQSAENGSPEGMYNLAFCYDGGFGLRAPDLARALYWYKQAAENGVPEAQLRMAVYSDSQGKPEQAFRYYKMLADGGETTSMNQVANFLLNGYGTSPNPAQAVEYLRRSSKAGNTRAMVMLADCYQKGLGVECSYKEMFHLLTLAAHDGDPEAQAKLGMCYQEGYGTNNNPEMAFHWFKISANSQYPTGQYMLAKCYRDGIGTDVDYQKALANFQLAAKGGDMLSLLEAAAILWEGGISVKRDRDQSYALYEQAAKSDLPMAWARFGAVAGVGTATHPANPKLAAEYLNRAATSNDAIAMIQAALCYLNGNGVKADKERARQIFAAAMKVDADAAQPFMDLYFPAQ